MSNRFEQESRIQNVAHSLEIDITDSVELADQTFFLVSDREGNRISRECYKRYSWFPIDVLSDVRLPKPGKGMKWIATEIFRPVSPMSAISVVCGMTPVRDLDHASDVVAFFDDYPEYVTSGGIQRGIDQLKNYIENA